MTKKQAIQLFQERKVRTAWDDEQEKWYFSVVDVCAVLTDSPNPRNYWKVLKHRLLKEGNQTVTNCNQLKLRAEDGRMRLTDVADTEQLFRLIQSIPSPKAEPFKQWMAQVASHRLDQMQDPELNIDQAIMDYKRLGYSDAWINQRIKSIEVRKELTDEWKRTGVQEGLEYASLTDIITREWSGFTTKQYKHFKGLKKENLRDKGGTARLSSVSWRVPDQSGNRPQYLGRGFSYRTLQTTRPEGFQCSDPGGKGWRQCGKGSAKPVGEQVRTKHYIQCQGQRLSAAGG